ncbi:MAG TPA: hypothetical protein VFN55_14115 [Solirubrobacteraceae bacterium]|nr:hypothetical protein [Solirubrobacteraceae bacterium]
MAALPHGILLACALAVLAALIHVQAAVDHLDEYAPYVVAFMVLAAGQTGWAVATYRSAGRSLLRTGVAAGGAVVLLWLVSRTVGLPVGPAQDSAEPVGLLGVVATLDELAVTALAVAALRARDATRGAGGRMLIATGLGLIVLSTLVLAGGLHAH